MNDDLKTMRERNQQRIEEAKARLGERHLLRTDAPWHPAVEGSVILTKWMRKRNKMVA